MTDSTMKPSQQPSSTALETSIEHMRAAWEAIDWHGVNRSFNALAAAFREMLRRPPFRGRYATGPLSEYRNRAEHARARRMASWRRKRDIRMGRCPL